MALLFIVPFLLLLGLVSRLRRKPFPPGPKGLPIIGNMMMMDQLTHRGLAKLAQKYGGIFHMKMGEEAKVNESDDLQNAIKLTRENIKAIIMEEKFENPETLEFTCKGKQGNEEEGDKG
ncbi:Cytochrome P450 [Corchorus capsularis]|uniref:Cytochrome P450 n=1 Tax=Corchorus capsularis TaxID=210143 RepID=A0A1R3GG01_COCAP|nr:Cytochrome P450 [Corchorus capsularis]